MNSLMNNTYLRKCPACKQMHFVRHRAKDYCSTECYQRHYNSLRKARHLDAFMSSEPYNGADCSYGKNYMNVESVQRNQEILANLKIKEEGTLVDIHRLNKEQFDFLAYSRIYPLKENNSAFVIEHGNYRTWLNDLSTLLIKPIIFNHELS